MDSHKPIKFFLRVGDNLVYDFGDLCNNKFHLDNVYKLYQEGILQRWLIAHDLHDKAESLSEFEKKYGKDEIDAVRAKEFCKIFFHESDSNAIEYIIQNFKLRERWKTEIEILDKKREDYFSYIRAYHHGYDELKQRIVRDALNMPAIKTHIEDLSTNYFELFKLDCSTWLDIFVDKAPVALLIMFANDVMRNFINAFPKLSTKGSEFRKAFDIIKKNIPSNPKDLEGKKLAPFIFQKESGAENIVSYIRYCNDQTNGDWDDIEPYKNKKFMILHKNSNLSVRPYLAPDSELPGEITDLPPIINGIEYKNCGPINYLIYMEV